MLVELTGSCCTHSAGLLQGRDFVWNEHWVESGKEQNLDLPVVLSLGTQRYFLALGCDSMLRVFLIRTFTMSWCKEVILEIDLIPYGWLAFALKPFNRRIDTALTINHVIRLSGGPGPQANKDSLTRFSDGRDWRSFLNGCGQIRDRGEERRKI
jgi:hypothetical protein